jgi:hypothetical protein
MAIRCPRRHHHKVASSPPWSLTPSFSEDDPTVINTFSSTGHRMGSRQMQRTFTHTAARAIPLVTEPGRKRFNIVEMPSSRASSSRASSTAPSEYAEDLEDAPPVEEDSLSLLDVDYNNILDALEFGDTHHAGESDWRKKRRKQWQRWSTETIPSLLVPYTSYLEASSSLQSTPLASSIPHCHAACQTKTIKVACVYFDRGFSIACTFPATESLSGLEAVTLSHCDCTPVPLQLMHRGLFGCAPVVPTLAVDLRVLQFLRMLFVRISPNMTAWCDAVEAFLDGLGYKLDNLVGDTFFFLIAFID